MTVSLSGSEVAEKIEKQFPEAVVEAGGNTVLLKSEAIFAAAEFLKSSPELDFNYLT